MHCRGHILASVWIPLCQCIHVKAAADDALNCEAEKEADDRNLLLQVHRMQPLATLANACSAPLGSIDNSRPMNGIFSFSPPADATHAAKAAMLRSRRRASGSIGP